jgi:hypothetical protein
LSVKSSHDDGDYQYQRRVTNTKKQLKKNVFWEKQDVIKLQRML